MLARSSRASNQTSSLDCPLDTMKLHAHDQCRRGWGKLFASIVLALTGAQAGAVGLGPVELRSRLGQALRAVVPLTLGSGERLAPACVRASRPALRDDGVPTLAPLRVALEWHGARGQLVLTTREAVQEPAVRVAVEVGCEAAVTREFVLLLDPPREGEAAAPAPAAGAAEFSSRYIDEQWAPAADASSPGPASRHRPAAGAVARPPVLPSARLSAAPAAETAMLPHTRSLARRHAKKAANAVPPKDRLRLSDDSGFIPRLARETGMRVDDRMLDRAPAPRDAVAKRSLALEQARTAAILRGEDPNAAVLAKDDEVARRLADIGREMAALRQQVDAASLNARRVQRESVPRGWWWSIVAVAVLACAAALALAWRLRRTRRGGDAPWWAPAPAAPAAAEQQAGASWIDLKKAMPEVTEDAAPRPAAPPPDPEVITQPLPPITMEGRRPTPWAPPPVAHASSTFGGETPLVIQRAILQKGAHIEVEELPHAAAFPEPQAPAKLDLELDLAPPEPPASALVTPPGASVTLPPLDFDTLATRSLPSAHQAGVLSPAIDLPTAHACQHALRLVFKVVAEADVLAVKGKEETAIVLLRRFVHDTEDLPPTPWLVLFNLYKATGKRPIYEALAGRFAKRFGRPLPGWDAAPIGEGGATLRAHPALQEAIAHGWGEPAAIAVLYNALMDYTAPEDRFFNLPLQRELLELVHTCPLPVLPSDAGR